MSDIKKWGTEDVMRQTLVDSRGPSGWISMNDYAALEGRYLELDAAYGAVLAQRDTALEDVEKFVAAIRSIAANTCCGQCQEAALIAKDVLTVCGFRSDQ